MTRSSAAAPKARPNIVVIMADDLGWMDLHCQGNDDLETPHLDRLASQGVRFSNAYAAAPVCTPTRAAMMTGSGSTVMAFLDHRDVDAIKERALKELDPSLWIKETSIL